MPVPKEAAKHSGNPVVRIVAHNTSPAQHDAITEGRIKLHAREGSVAVEDVESLLDEAVDADELETFGEDAYIVPE